MFDSKTVTLNLGHTELVEINKIANAYAKMAYQKSIENKLAVLKEMYAIKMIASWEYEKKLNELWADVLRGE